jgi:hypothetical protein
LVKSGQLTPATENFVIDIISYYAYGGRIRRTLHSLCGCRSKVVKFPSGGFVSSNWRLSDKCVRSASVYNMRHLESLMQMRVSTNYKSSFDACSSEIIGKSFFVRYLLALVIHDLEAMANDMGYVDRPFRKRSVEINRVLDLGNDCEGRLGISRQADYATSASQFKQFWRAVPCPEGTITTISGEDQLRHLADSPHPRHCDRHGIPVITWQKRPPVCDTVTSIFRHSRKCDRRKQRHLRSILCPGRLFPPPTMSWGRSVTPSPSTAGVIGRLGGSVCYGSKRNRAIRRWRGSMSAVSPIVLQNSANERSTPKNGQYQNPKGRFLESKFPFRDLI